MTEQQQPTNDLATAASDSIKPAGFWIRFIAILIDWLIVSILQQIVLIPLLGGIPALDDSYLQNVTVTGIVGANVISMIIGLAYSLYFYTRKGATLGKLAFQIRVVDKETGEWLSWKQVILREYLGKILSCLSLMIGFIMAGFRVDKRALHDLIANTQCLRKKETA